MHAPHHWRGGDERERERGTEERSIREIQNDLGGREGTAMLGTKMKAAALLLILPTSELKNRVRLLRWHYETRLLRWAGHIARMKHDRLPLMLLTSWVPNSRPIDCPRMTFGRTVKKAMKRWEEIWPGLPFDMRDNWTALTDAAHQQLR